MFYPFLLYLFAVFYYIVKKKNATTNFKDKLEHIYKPH